MSTLSFDPTASRLCIETRATGMLAKLAHDLNIEAKDLRVTVTAAGGGFELEIGVPVAKLEIDGVRRGGHVDRTVLSASDKADIGKKIREDVLPAPEVVVKAKSGDVTLDPGRRDVDVTGTIALGRKSAPMRTRAAVDVLNGRLKVSGRVHVSLGSLDIPAPKGPLGAFKVDDAVEIVFELAFSR